MRFDVEIVPVPLSQGYRGGRQGWPEGLKKSAWLGGRPGCLPALQQAKAWALREVWRETGKGDYGMNTFVAGKLKKQFFKVEANLTVQL